MKLSQLTDKQRKKVAPTRANGLATMPGAKRVDNALKGMVEDFRKWWGSNLQQGLASTAPDLRPMADAALGLLNDLSLQTIAEATVEGLAVALAMQHRRGEPLINGILVAHGPMVTLEVVRRSWDFGFKGEDPNPGLWVVQQPLDRVLDSEALRTAVCLADEDQYQTMLRKAAWADQSVFVKASLAYAFPDEDWANQ